MPKLLAAGCGVVVLLAAIGLTLWYVATIATERPKAKPKATATATVIAAPPKPPTSPTQPLLPGKR